MVVATDVRRAPAGRRFSESGSGGGTLAAPCRSFPSPQGQVPSVLRLGGPLVPLGISKRRGRGRKAAELGGGLKTWAARHSLPWQQWCRQLWRRVPGQWRGHPLGVESYSRQSPAMVCSVATDRARRHCCHPTRRARAPMLRWGGVPCPPFSTAWSQQREATPRSRVGCRAGPTRLELWAQLLAKSMSSLPFLSCRVAAAGAHCAFSSAAACSATSGAVAPLPLTAAFSSNALAVPLPGHPWPDCLPTQVSVLQSLRGWMLTSVGRPCAPRVSVVLLCGCPPLGVVGWRAPTVACSGAGLGPARCFPVTLPESCAGRKKKRAGGHGGARPPSL